MSYQEQGITPPNVTPPASAKVVVFLDATGDVQGVQHLDNNNQWQNATHSNTPPGPQKWPERALSSVKPLYFLTEASGVDPCIQQGNKLYCW